MLVSAIIAHFYEVRWPNLPIIARALRSGSHPPHEILVWNNEAQGLPPIDGVQVIQSHRNVGCMARFVASFVARGEWLLYHDNDMMCGPETVSSLLVWAQQLGEVADQRRYSS